MSVIADGTAEVRKAAREELRKGATQIKLFASGGVVFPAEGHATRYEFSEEELKAVVEEATARGTYVMAHVYTDEGVRRCLRAGVRSIEHANFVTEDTVAMMADYHAFYVPTFISLVQRMKALTRRICRRPSSRTCSARSLAASRSMVGPASTKYRSASAPTCGAPMRRNVSCGNSRCARGSIRRPTSCTRPP